MTHQSEILVVQISDNSGRYKCQGTYEGTNKFESVNNVEIEVVSKYELTGLVNHRFVRISVKSSTDY